MKNASVLHKYAAGKRMVLHRHRLQYPVPDSLVPIKQKRDAEIRNVLTGKSDKLLVIIGPCSADNEDAVCDYIHRLAKVNDKVSDRLILIPRIYTNKPRTTGDGYKGIVHQPDPEKKEDFLHGLIAMRHMHIRALSETGLSAADEMLYPEKAIETVQRWSDEHPPKTYLTELLKTFPNTQLNDSGTPKEMCPHELGLNEIEDCGKTDNACVKCWSQPIEDDEK